MNLPLKKLLIGKTDGKHEYIDSPDGADAAKFDTFLMPESVDPARLHNGDIFFVEGFRGTGKTSLLRWHSNDQKNQDAVTNFVLFKSDLTEDQRLHLSREVGITWVDIEPKKMEIVQDFKSAWSWFIVHKIGEILKEDASLTSVGSEGLRKKAVRLLGLDDDNVLKKAIGFMPRLEGAHVKVKADIAFFEAELGGDFTRNGDQGAVSLQALYKKAASIIGSLDMVRPLYIYFDELEAFYHSPEQHRRDQRMVRDLLFSIANMNEHFRSKRVAIHIIGAVRSEVIDAMGSLGQEIDRLVHDKGFSISWHHANRSASHPLIQIIAKKIKLSEETHGFEVSSDSIRTYFPNNINGQSIDILF
nr:hypothetical protein [uncultured Novosphingobium sp.]